MTLHSTSTHSNGLRLPGLKALAVAVGVTALAATGAWAAQHETKPQQGQTQQMPGPAFERMQELMQQARETKDPAERRQLMREHIEMMGEQMQEMMGAAAPEMMTRMREHLGMMQQMMEQMLEQQKMMMEMNEQQ
ncbi:hypothetical protein [Acuticoccus sediminis]|uniref:hypothetical protein n=1 Tax=Acuticoccus sediminis TaxID=2184697 RepID=UPI000DAB5EA2|nr:hypothetical protein [Acuticoccus sediminis]